MAELTPNLRLVKPTINGEDTENTWGYDLNSNFDILDDAVVQSRVSDGDKGDIIVSAQGELWKFDPTVVTAAGRGVIAVDAQAGLLEQNGATAFRKRGITVAQQPPSGGVDGDLWLQYNLALPPEVNWDVSSAYFNSRAEAITSDIPGTVKIIQTGGFLTSGDYGQGAYKRLDGPPATNPTNPRYFRSVDRNKADGGVDLVLGGYWDLVPVNGTVTIEQFGGKGDLDWATAGATGVLNGTDNYQASVDVQEAYAYFASGTSTGQWGGPTVFFQPDRAYGFSRSIEMRRTMQWAAQNTGMPGAVHTFLMFAAGAHGFIAHYPRTTHAYTFDGAGKILTSAPGSLTATVAEGPGSAGSVIRNLHIRSLGGQEGFGINVVAKPWDPNYVYTLNQLIIAGAGKTYTCTTPGPGTSTIKPTHTSGANAPGVDGYVWTFKAAAPVAHGINMRAMIEVRDCNINFFNGDLIHIYAVATGGAATFGNCNLFRIHNVRLINGGKDGIYVEGPDANAGSIHGADIQICYGWGVHDNSYLGNAYNSCHVEGSSLRNIASHGDYRQYELTTDPGGSILTSSEPEGLVTGVEVIGADGYGWTRRDRGKWMYGSSYAVNDILWNNPSNGFFKVVTAGPGLSTILPTLGNVSTTLADGFVWVGVLSGGNFPWQAKQNYSVGQTFIWGGFVYYCDNPAQGHLVEPGILAPSTLVRAVDNAVWKNIDGLLLNTAWMPYLWSSSQVYIDGGSYRSSQGTAQTTFNGCYSEGNNAPANIKFPAQYWGGIGVGPTRRASDASAAGMTGNLMGPFETLCTFTSTYPLDTDTQPPMKMAHSRAKDDFLTLIGGPLASEGAQFASYNDTFRCMQRGYNHGVADWITVAGTTLTCGRAQPIPTNSLVIPLGFFMGASHINARRMTNDTGTPVITGDYARGEISWNLVPSAGGKAGWICTTAGGTAPLWVSGTNYNVNPNCWVRSAAGRYYRCTTSPFPVVPSIVEPSHLSGTVTDPSDGYAWLYFSSTTAVWKAFGAIDP